MTEQEKQEIISAVLSAIRTNSKTIAQLSPKQSLNDSDMFEVAGGSRVTYLVLKNAIREGLALASQLSDYLTEENAAIYLAKLDTKTGTIDFRESPCVMLDGFKDVNGYTPVTGDLYYENKRGYQIWVKDVNGESGWKANTHATYVNKNEGAFYRWTGTKMERIGGGVTVINDLTTGGEGDALSAKMGKKLKANVEIVQSNVNALLNALAGIAFTGSAPTLTELDWGGEKYSVTVNNSLTGCNADKSGVLQVTEGSSLVVTLTAGKGKLIRSVIASAGTVVIAANKKTATVTLSNVSADATLTITAEATNANSYSATISDSKVDGTGASSGITEGSSYTSVLSLNNTADESDAITNVQVLMDGSGSSISATESNGTWTVHTDFVTGNITIAVTVTGVTRHTISWQGTGFKMYSDSAHQNQIDTPQSIVEGSDFEAYLVPDQFYSIDPSTGVSFSPSTGASYNSSTGKITIENVTANVAITVTAVSVNVAYKNVGYVRNNKDNIYLAFGDDEECFVSPIIDLNDFIAVNGSVHVQFKSISSSTNKAFILALYDEGMNYVNFYSYDTVDKHGALSLSKYKYVRITGRYSDIADCYVKDYNDSNSSTNKKFDGSKYANVDLLSWEKFFDAGFESIEVDSAGNWLHVGTMKATGKEENIGPTASMADSNISSTSWVLAVNAPTIEMGRSPLIDISDSSYSSSTYLTAYAGYKTNPGNLSYLRAPSLIVYSADGSSKGAYSLRPQSASQVIKKKPKESGYVKLYVQFYLMDDENAANGGNEGTAYLIYDKGGDHEEVLWAREGRDSSQDDGYSVPTNSNE